MIKKYGKVKEEKRIEESIKAREITKTILDYGVSQYQIAKIVYLLALELENRDMSDNIIVAVKPATEEATDESQQQSKIIVR